MNDETQNHNQEPRFDNSRIKELVRRKMREQRRARLRRRIYISACSAAAVVILLFGVNLLMNVGNKLNLREATAEAIQEAGYIEVTVPNGERMEIELPDGSHMIANHNSRVVYPEKFTGDDRRIYANGQVFIEVAKDKEHPFIVESAGFDIKVLGTVFNIDNISETTANIVLVEGSINLTTSKNQNINLKPNDLVEIQDGDIATLKQVDPDDYTAWIKGLVSLKGETMSDLAKRLSDYYDVHVTCDQALSNTKVYGKLDLRDSIEDVLTTVKEIVPMKINKSGNNISLKGV